MTTRLRVTYFQGGRSKPQRLLIAVGRAVSVTEARQEIQKALTSLTDGGSAPVKTLWTSEGFLLPDSYTIGALVESGDEIYASEKKTNVAPQLPASAGAGAGKAVKREREEAAADPAPSADDAPPAVASKAAGAKSKGKAEPAAKKPRAARGASAYNLYMRTAMPRWKAENPGKSHKEAFAACAGQWKTSSENPKNGGAASGGQSATSLSSTPPANAAGDDMGPDSDAESGTRRGCCQAAPGILTKLMTRRTFVGSCVCSRNGSI